MRKITMFQCEVCNKFYHSEEEAIECELRGKELPLGKVGSLVEYEVKINGYDRWFEELRICRIKDTGHYLIYFFEEYNPDEGLWEESIHFNSVWGNEEFKKLVTLK